MIKYTGRSIDITMLTENEEEDLAIMHAIDPRLETKSDWVREIIKRFL